MPEPSGREAGGFRRAYKLAGLNLDVPVVNDLELVSRYDGVNDAHGNNHRPRHSRYCLLPHEHIAARR